MTSTGAEYADSGGASRFFQQTTWDADLDGPSFQYVAKPSKKERNAGLDNLEKKPAGVKNSSGRGFSESDPHKEIKAQNFHPTVKPVALMRYLVRLVTPPGGTVLEPFAGSGTTMVAAILEGFQPVGIELTADYVPIIEGRLAWALEQAAAQQVVVAPPDDQPTLFD
jgi:site-specific DNA-methyltransferase (adenine-specific)